MKKLEARIRLIEVPTRFCEENFKPVDKLQIIKQCKQVLSVARQPNQTIYVQSLLADLVKRYQLAEVAVFKAEYELAIGMSENATQTLRDAQKAQIEPQELLRDTEAIITTFTGEKPRIRLHKPKNDKYSNYYAICSSFSETIHALCRVFAVQRGVPLDKVLVLQWNGEEREVATDAEVEAPAQNEALAQDERPSELQQRISSELESSRVLNGKEEVPLLNSILRIEEQAERMRKEHLAENCMQHDLEESGERQQTLHRAAGIYTRGQTALKYRPGNPRKYRNQRFDVGSLTLHYNSLFDTTIPSYLRDVNE